jgi:hypothetical protein
MGEISVNFAGVLVHLQTLQLSSTNPELYTYTTLLYLHLAFIILLEHMLVSKNMLATGLACRMLVCLCLLGRSINVHTKPEKPLAATR